MAPRTASARPRPARRAAPQAAPQPNRRRTPPRPETALYQQPLAPLLATERRADELARLHEALSQRQLWRHTLGWCAALNAAFILAGLYGWWCQP